MKAAPPLSGVLLHRLREDKLSFRERCQARLLFQMSQVFRRRGFVWPNRRGKAHAGHAAAADFESRSGRLGSEPLAGAQETARLQAIYRSNSGTRWGASPSVGTYELCQLCAWLR